MFIQEYLPIVVLASMVSLGLGAIFALKIRDHHHLLLGFGAGSMVGVAIFALLPEVLDNTHYTHYGEEEPSLAWLVGVGFVAYMILERFFMAHFHRDDGCQSDRHDGRFGAAAIIVHGAIDGFAVMASFCAGTTVGYSVVLAIIVHQFSDAMNVVTMMMRGTKDAREAGDHGLYWRSQQTAIQWLYGLLIAVTLGMLSGLLMPDVFFENIRVVIAVLAGIFLYVGAADLIPESHHGHPTIWTTVATIAGMGVIYWVTTIGHA